MAIDLGDPYPLAVFITDDLGAPANAGTVVVTVTLPDLTSVTPAVTNGAVGTYTASYPTTQAGRHTARWVATGTSTPTFTLPVAYTDEFTVLPADPGFIISLADARAGLSMVAANTVKDEDLRTYIAAVSPIMEDIVGPILRTTRTETYDGGSTRIALLWSPVISVATVTESYGTFARTLTAQDVFAGSGLDSYGYTVDLTSGVLSRRFAGISGPFPAGRRNIQVTYVSGRASIGGNVLLATRRLIRHLWQSEQQGYRPQMGAPETAMGYTPSGFAVPKAVLELCAADTRVPGIA